MFADSRGRHGFGWSRALAVAVALPASNCYTDVTEEVAHNEASAQSVEFDMPGADGGVEQPRCVPTADGPFWTLEGETIEVFVRCATGLALAGRQFFFEDLPRDALYDAGKSRLFWKPGLDQAGIYDLNFSVPDTGESGAETIGVADRWDDPDNQPVDPLSYPEEYGLPVFHLERSKDFNANEHTDVGLVYRGRRYQGVQGKKRGKTSLKYPKTSFTIKFSKHDLLTDEEHGLFHERRVVLTTTFDDNSYLRQRLAFQLWNRLDPEHIQIEAFNAVLFLDGEYHGLYTVTDHVDDELMEDNGLDKDGNLYKARSAAANFLLKYKGKKKSSLHLGYTKEEGEPPEGEPGAFDDLDALVQWVNTADDEQFAAELDQRIARREFEDWWIFVSLISACDSAGKNSYLYRDPRPDAPDPLFHYAPWDFNASFGQSFKTVRRDAEEPLEIYRKLNRLFDRMLADPGISAAMSERYARVLRGAFEVESVIALVDGWVLEVDRSARRDEMKWGEAYREYYDERDDFTTYEDEIDYLRGWIRDRWSFVEELY